MLIGKSKFIRELFGLLETFNFLSLKLLFKNPASLRSYPGKVYRDYMTQIKTEKWVCKSIFEIFPRETSMRFTVEHIIGEGISTPIQELANLAFITKAGNPENIFEIGTFRGRTALNFALNSPESCRIYTMDLPPSENQNILNGYNSADKMIISKSITGIDYQGKDVAHKIIQLYGDSMEFDFTPYYGKMDIIFIDGAHHYLAVKSDIENALKMVAPNGYIIWHDFANYGEYNDVTRAILEKFPKEQIIQIDNTQLAIYKNHQS